MRVTGLGSWPGEDLPAALRLTLGELPELPYLPELPARGPGAQMIGRGVAVLASLAADLRPSGWRLTGADAGSGRDQRRARAILRDDLDFMEETAHEWNGDFVISVVGPWTLAGSVELPRGELVMADLGARRELHEALAQGIADLLTEVRRRLPAAQVRLQVDEPLLTAVHRGTLRSVSGYRRHRSVDLPELAAGLELVRTGGADVLHSCAPDVPWSTVLGCGFAAAADLDQISAADWDIFGPHVEAGGEFWLGVAPTHLPDVVPTPDQLASRAIGALRSLELGPAVAEHVVLTPACGVAGWQQRPAIEMLRALTAAARITEEELAR